MGKNCYLTNMVVMSECILTLFSCKNRPMVKPLWNFFFGNRQMRKKKKEAKIALFRTKEKKFQCVKLSACQTVKPYKPDIGIVAWKASNSFPSLTTFCTARETRSSSRLSNLSRRSTASRCRCRRACTFCIFSKITALTSSGDLVSMSSYLTLDAVGRGSIETSHIDNSRGAPVESSGNGFANVQGRLVLEVSCLK